MLLILRRLFISCLKQTFLIALIFSDIVATAEEICLLKDQDGMFKVFPKHQLRPDQLRAAKCRSMNQERELLLPNPSEIKIEGGKRRTKVNSQIGIISLSWSRADEQSFGTSLERALSDTTQAISRAIRQFGISDLVQNGANQEIEMAFIDGALEKKDIPFGLVTNCHPAWMQPPNKLFFVPERMVSACGYNNKKLSSKEAIQELFLSLAHEIGHLIEWRMLGDRQFGENRARAEGFATWFANYASGFSPLFLANEQELFLLRVARANPISEGAFQGNFGDSIVDYAWVGLWFSEIVRLKGLKVLEKIYRRAYQGEYFEDVLVQLTGLSGTEIMGSLKKRILKEG
ncbi:MAG TPA: hypothetical protein PKD37_02035 [Oligoflexia bacterium]|nr:hypothetical protein [Oligoflexia bacterium]HMP26756.1 hypothetical protein [Oligoflexia bacterium]